MAVPPELMQMMQGGAGAPPGGAGDPGGPVGSPMAQPQPKAGLQAAAHAKIQMAIDLVEQSIAAFGSESPEGQTLLKCATALGKTFGEQRTKGRELIPAEMKLLLQSQGAGGPPPGAPPGAPPMPGM